MDYDDPVNKLLNYGSCQKIKGWPDYLKIGLTHEHIPELIRMVTDRNLLWADQESLEVWAPVHAWRALGQLRAEEAIKPLIGLFKGLSDDDWASDELPDVMMLFGEKAIKPLREYLLDSSNKELARATAASCLEKIGNKNSSLKKDCISILAEYLEQSTVDVPTLSGLVIAHLIELEAADSIDVIRKAFNYGNVDLTVAGDLEDVEILLGLREKRETPQPNYFNPEFEKLSSNFDSFKAKKKKIGRNDPCPCGSGKKYKKCCLNKTSPH
jgi:hypothetical protein